MSATNWGGNYAYLARQIRAPSSVKELQEIVSSSRRVRVLGARHSFTAIADSAELVTLDGIRPHIVIDSDAMTVSFGGALRYGELAMELERHGLALSNLGSLPHLAVAGAISTATHGSGERNGNLATAVAALEIVTGDGEVLRTSRGEPDFDGMVVGLGAVGALTRITLDVEPTYQVRQRVFDRLSWDALFEHFDAIMSSGHSVSVFTRWGPTTEQVWVKRRDDEGPDFDPPELFGAVAATAERHPIPGLDPANSTPQLGVPGPWYDRLPHFRMGFVPSSGAEIQSEYLFARRFAVPAIEAVRRLSPTIQPLTQISEIRTVAADTLWMSPEYGQDTVGIHFTWQLEQAAVERALAEVERALAPFDARPHWGKLFLGPPKGVGRSYERFDDFASLLERIDPAGVFRNEWLERQVFGR
jgi:xylitol oxidase